MLCGIVLRGIVLCGIVLCGIMLCSIVLCCVVWYCGIDGVRGDNRGKLPLDHVAEAQARGNKAKAGRGVGK